MPSTRKRTLAQPEEVPEGNGPAATSEAPPLEPPKKRQRQPRSKRMQPQPESLSEEQLEDSSQSEPLSEEQPGSSSQPSQPTGSAKRKPCVPHPLRHLTARRTRSRIDSLFERSDFSPEQLLAIRDSANKVLLNLLATSTSSSTGNCYKKHLKRWQAYRDAIASETQTEPDYTVDSVRVIKFFIEVIFKKSARKTIDPRVGYSGAVSLAASVPEVDYDLSDDEAVGTGSEDDEELAPGRWQPATPPAGVTETECAEVQALSTTNASLSRKQEHIDIDDPTVDERGRITFDTPLGRWTVLSCQNALVYLWRRQIATSADFPNPASSPRDDLTLQKAIEEYTTRLVYREATTGESRKTSCSARAPHTAEQFMRKISLTWRMFLFPQAKGKRKYDSERIPYIREHFNIRARHHMLQRDEDVRNLALSDVFSTRSRHLAHGSALATGIVFRYGGEKPTRAAQTCMRRPFDTAIIFDAPLQPSHSICLSVFSDRQETLNHKKRKSSLAKLWR